MDDSGQETNSSQPSSSQGEIHCSVHSDKPAVSCCVACGRAICVECRNENEAGLSICRECAEKAAKLEADRAVVKEVQTAQEQDREREEEEISEAAQMLVQQVLSAQQKAQERLQREEPIAWESTRSRNDFAAFLKTCAGAFLRPLHFMTHVPWVRRDFCTPLCFALLCGSIGQLALVIQFFTSGKNPAIPMDYGQNISYSALAFLALTVAPLTLLVEFLVESGFAHFLIRISGFAKRPYEATFRAFAYAQVARMALVLPSIGVYIQNFFLIFLLLNGVRIAHRAGLGAGLLALLPMILLQGFAGSLLQTFALA